MYPIHHISQSHPVGGVVARLILAPRPYVWRPWRRSSSSALLPPLHSSSALSSFYWLPLRNLWISFSSALFNRAADTLFQLSDEFILFLCNEIANVSLCNTLCRAPCLCREPRSLMMIQRFAASFHTNTQIRVFTAGCDIRLSQCSCSCFTDNLSCCSPSKRCQSLYLSACCWLDVGLSPAPHSYFKSRGDHGWTFSSWTVERPHSARRGDSVKTTLF